MSRNIVIVQDETAVVRVGNGISDRLGEKVCLTFVEAGMLSTRTQVKAFFSVEIAQEIVDDLQKLIKKMNAAA